MRHGMILSTVALLWGCGGGALEGTWIGDLECQSIDFDFTLELSKDSGKVFTGSGTQERTFVSTGGKTTDEQIDFDVTLELESNSGAQDMDTELVCTYEDKVEFGVGGGDPVTLSEGCTPRRFDQWELSWDGSDTIDISAPPSAPFGCIGSVDRR